MRLYRDYIRVIRIIEGVIWGLGFRLPKSSCGSILGLEFRVWGFRDCRV